LSENSLYGTIFDKKGIIYMEENISEMLKHLDNILVKINLLSKNTISELKYNLEDLEKVKNIITHFKDSCQD